MYILKLLAALGLLSLTQYFIFMSLKMSGRLWLETFVRDYGLGGGFANIVLYSSAVTFFGILAFICGYFAMDILSVTGLLSD